jgi:glutamine amidotransferase
MCRFVLYMGPKLTLDTLITKPTHSLVHQSYQSEERKEPLNGDGFGIAWYVPRLSADPAVFRSISPAWSHRCLQDMCRVTESSVVLAHIRAASPGLPVMETNCHPFTSGRFSFMHNGYIQEFRKVKRRLRTALTESSYNNIEGSTDSEHIFAIFLDEFSRIDGEGVEDMANALDATIAKVVELSQSEDEALPLKLNLVVSNGEETVVSRFAFAGDGLAPSLYVHKGRRYICEDGLCHMLQTDDDNGAVVISSECLSDDHGWDKVEKNHLVLVNKNHLVEIRPVSGVFTATED